MSFVFCPTCLINDSKIISKKETFDVKGDKIDITSNVRICNKCGQEIFDEELDSANLERAYAIYRKRCGLMTPDEIREIREKYRLSQRAFGKILGWGEITIHRYETGAIQDEAHNNILELLKNPENMKAMLLKNKDKLNASQYKKAMAAVNQMLYENPNSALFSHINDTLQMKPADIYSGYKKFDLEKFLNTILFFSTKDNELYKTKLNKYLFYFDFLTFKHTTVSATGSRYKKYPYGPVPEDYDLLLWIAEKESYVEILPTQKYDYTGEIIKPLADYDEDIFTEDEFKILNKILNMFIDKTAAVASQISHDEEGYKQTKDRELISYEYANAINLIHEI